MWGYEHLKVIASIRSHLSSRTPSLLTSVKMYRDNAEDVTNYNEDQRNLWTMMADELEARRGVSNMEQLALIEEDPTWQRVSRQRLGGS